MPTPYWTQSVSDSRRDAERYYQILLALDRATYEVRRMEHEADLDIDELLDRLLPDLSKALNAKQAFVAALRENESEEGKWLELTAVHPRRDLRGKHLTWSDLLRRVIEEGKPTVVDPLGEEEPDPIPGLEIFNATSVILVRMQTLDCIRIVGLCNKDNPDLGPFLVPDRMVLDNIVELLAMGARTGERRRRELRSIQKTSAAISAELELDELLPAIAERAANVFDAPATSLMLWDESGENLIIKASYGLSDEYVQKQRISAEKPYVVASGNGGLRPFTVVDLRQGPSEWQALIAEERLYAMLPVPLEISGGSIGTLNIYSGDIPRHFTQDEKELARIFANQAATAIQNAWLYEAVKRRSEHLRALHEASKAITAGFSVDRRQVLDRIALQAVERISGVEGPKAVSATILLYDETARELRLESVYPPSMFSEFETKLGGSISLDKDGAPAARTGIVGRAFLEAKAQRVGDARTDPDYIEFDARTESELDVPLLDGDKIIGVLSVESDQRDAFDEDDEKALEGLADLAVIAIKNAEQVDRLKRTDAVALMGAWGADVAHDVNREVGAIRRAVFVLQQQPDLPDGVKERLADIDHSAGLLALPELPAQAPSPGQVVEFQNAPLLDRAVLSEVESHQAAYPSVSLQLEENCPKVRVAIHEMWLRRLVRHLIRNSVRATPPEQETLRVTVRTFVQGSIAEVQVEDTGEGVRPEIERLLFRQPIPHADGRLGWGLLLVGFLAEQHGGYAKLVRSHPGAGACFAIGIPQAQPVADSP